MAQTIRFLLNNQTVQTDLHPGTVVLDFLRKEQRLTGTKEGCREGDCGACAVLLGELSAAGEAGVAYRVVNSCLLPLGEVQGRHLVSIEGLNLGEANERSSLTLVQSHLVEQGAIQCGFCTPGFVVSLTGYLLAAPSPPADPTVRSGQRWNYEDALAAVAGNICRCTGYASIKRAIAALLEQLAAPSPDRDSTDGSRLGVLKHLVACRVVPDYFLGIPERLRKLGMQVPEAGHPDGPGEPTVVAGGTDLFVQKPKALLSEPLSFVSDSAELRKVRVENERLYLGAGIVMEEVKDIPELEKWFPQVIEALPLIASAPIRHRATLGGNIVNASPIGDFTVMLLSLGAVLGLNAGGAIREVALPLFFQGYKQLDRRPGERLKWIALPLLKGLFSFEKVSRRRHLDIASVNSAAWCSLRGERLQTVRLAAGGVAPVPLFLSRASACLEGEVLTEELLERALDLAQEEISPIDDVRGSAPYKRLLLRQLLLAHFKKLFPQRFRAEVWV